ETNAEWAAVTPMLAFGLTLVGTLYSAYLTYLELFVIFAICPYCVTSAVIMVALFGLALYRLLQAPPE
ncbi:MAG: vitamin K epoxide reductase family protein, partial [Chloroflexota bacterium]